MGNHLDSVEYKYSEIEAIQYILDIFEQRIRFDIETQQPNLTPDSILVFKRNLIKNVLKKLDLNKPIPNSIIPHAIMDYAKDSLNIIF